MQTTKLITIETRSSFEVIVTLKYTVAPIRCKVRTIHATAQ